MPRRLLLPERVPQAIFKAHETMPKTNFKTHIHTHIPRHPLLSGRLPQAMFKEHEATPKTNSTQNRSLIG